MIDGCLYRLSGKSPDVADSETILRSWAILSHAPTAFQFVQFNLPETQVHLLHKNIFPICAAASTSFPIVYHAVISTVPPAHAPCCIPYVVPMLNRVLIGCGLVLVIRFLKMTDRPRVAPARGAGQQLPDHRVLDPDHADALGVPPLRPPGPGAQAAARARRNPGQGPATTTLFWARHCFGTVFSCVLSSILTG